jgi:hypothetical protein
MRLPIALAVLCLSAACGASPSSGTATATPIYVFNFFGAEDGRTDQRPRDLVVSEFSTINGLTWQSWGPSRAVGMGKLSGTWCLPECLDKPYDARVTLSNVIPVKGQGYFTKYRIEAKLPADQKETADLSGVLQTP